MTTYSSILAWRCSGGLRPLVEMCVEPTGLCGRCTGPQGYNYTQTQQKTVPEDRPSPPRASTFVSPKNEERDKTEKGFVTSKSR